MASHSGKNVNKSVDTVKSDPIKLQKTNNITQIKGWRNKKFTLESANNEADQVDNEVSKSTNESVSEVVSKDIGTANKANRNSDLLDSLVKKIGGSSDIRLGSNILGTISMHVTNNTHEIVASSSSNVSNTNFCNDMLIDSKFVAKETVTIPSHLSDVIAFERSAFVSESLDEFLSSEPAIVKLNNPRLSSNSTEIQKVLRTKREAQRMVSQKPNWNLVSNTRKLLDEYGNRPRTLAEKRRILESSGSPNKKGKTNAKTGQTFKKSNRRKFRRKDKILVKRILRSTFKISSSHVTTSRRRRFLDDPLDSVVDGNTETTSPEESKISSSTNQVILNNLNRLRHPLASSSISQKYKHSEMMRQKIKEKLRKLNKKAQMKKALRNAVYIRPLKRRILFDFMPLLKDNEITTANSLDTKKVGMVLFTGMGRCLYEEQAENVEMLRPGDGIIDKNFVRFATSTVLNRAKPNSLTPILLPVVSAKLLTFMNNYELIRAYYKEFLINKYNINVSSTIPTALPIDSTKGITNASSNTEERTSKNATDTNDSTGRVKENEQIIRPVTNVKQKLVGDNLKRNVECDKHLADVKTTGTDTETSINVSTEDSLLKDDAFLKTPSTDGETNGSRREVKLKKRVTKKGKVLHKDKRMNKLNNELRRLNHAFVEIDSESSNDEQSSLNKPAGSNMLPDNVASSKLAKVESEFHHTVMKSEKEFVFMSSFNNRSNRNIKLPKKLEDAVLSDEAALMNIKLKRPSSRSSDETIPLSERLKMLTSPTKEEVIPLSKRLKMLTSPTKEEVIPLSKRLKMLTSPTKEDRDLPPRVIQPESPKRRGRVDISRLKSKPATAVRSDEVNNGQECSKDSRETGTVIVQTSKSILKRNVCSNVTKDKDIVLNSLERPVSSDDSDITSSVVNVNKRTKLKCMDGKYPVLVLEKLKITDSTRIWCVIHTSYSCPCLNENDATVKECQNIAVKGTNSSINTSDFVNTFKQFLQRDCTIDVIDLDSSSECSSTETVVIDEPMVVDCESNMVVPRIEKVMTLKPEEFFKDGLSDSVCDGVSAGVVNSERANQTASEIPGGSNIETSNGSPLELVHRNNYRFFCMLFNCAFSYVKYLGGIDIKKMPELQKQLRKNNSSIDKANLGVILAYSGLLNMVNDSYNKRQCIFHHLIKANYDPEKFNNLPFGVYAVGRNMVLFGPYDINESHELQAYKVVRKKRPKDGSEKGTPRHKVVDIPFVLPEHVNQFNSEHVIGYWWYVVGNGVIKDQALLNIINTKRLVNPVKLNASLLVPLLPLSQKNQVSSKQYITGVLNGSMPNATPGTNSHSFIKVTDFLHNKTVVANKSNKKRNKDSSIIDNDSNNSAGGSNSEDTIDKAKGSQKASAADRNTPISCLKYPVINVKNSRIMSVVYPEGKNSLTVTKNDVNLNNPKLQKIIQEKFSSGNVTSNPMMVSVQPTGDVYSVILCKLRETEDATYYNFKNNKDQVIKISKVNKNITILNADDAAKGDSEPSNNSNKNSDKPVVSLTTENSSNITDPVEASNVSHTPSTDSLPTSAKRDTTIVCKKSIKLQKNSPIHSSARNKKARNVSKCLKCVKTIALKPAEEISNASNAKGSNTSSGHDKTKESSKTLAIDIIRPKPASTLQTSNKSETPGTSFIQIVNGCVEDKSNKLKIASVSSLDLSVISSISGKAMSSSILKPPESRVESKSCTTVTKDSSAKKLQALDHSRGYIPITSALLQKNDGISSVNSDTDVLKTTKPNRKLLSVLKPSDNCVKDVSPTIADKECVTSAPEASQASADDPAAVGNEDKQLNKSVATVKTGTQLKGNRVNLPKGVLLKVTVKGDSNLFKLSSKSDSISIADLNSLVTALNKRISVKRDKPPGTTILTSTDDNKLLNSIVDETCSITPLGSTQISPSDLSNSDALNMPIVWDSSTLRFNINKNMKSTEQISLSKHNSALSQLSNTSISSEIDISISASPNSEGKSVDVSETLQCSDMNELISPIKTDYEVILDDDLPENSHLVEIDAGESNEEARPSINEEDVPIPSTDISLPCSSHSTSDPPETSEIPEDDDVELVSAFTTQSTSSPSLKNTMINLIKEAKTVSTLNADQNIDESPISEELKLVSSLDSLPNFLESYGIHFTDI